MLNDDERFRDGLRLLYEKLRPEVSQAVDADAALDAYLRAAFGPRPPTDHLKACRELETFAERWRLPRKYGVTDVWWSLCRMDVDGQPRLRVGYRSYQWAFQPTIRPYQSRAFVYDPVSHGSGWLREHAKQEAALEREEVPEWCDTQSVRTTVKNWAEALDVPLPLRQRGRPTASG